MTAGVRTTMGSVVYEHRVPERNSAVAERVLNAGAVMLGKTNVPEFGMVGCCENSLGVLGLNPWNTDRTPGGSSGGAAAAVAAYLCPVATGSDGGRIAPHTRQLLRHLHHQAHPGPRIGLHGAGRASDAEHLLPVRPVGAFGARRGHAPSGLGGFDRRDQASIRQTPPDFMAATERGIDGLRIGWSADFGFAPVFPEVVDVTYKAAMVFEELGCSVEEVNMVLPEPYDSFGPIQSASAYNGLAQHLDEYGDRMTEFARFFIEMGSRVTTDDYMRAEGRMAELKATFDDAFETYDLIMSPVTSFPAFPNETFPGSITGDSSYPIQYWNGAFTMHGNAIGHPAASVPAGFSPDGLPIGLQIIGRKYDEETVLAASAAFEQARPWIHHRPAVS